MRKIRWIHFSDLHLGDDAATATRLMRRTLPEYVARLNCTFDYAFCSGDIKEWKADYSTAPDYLRKLCEVANTPLDRLFIVPGNHDVDLVIGGKTRDELIAKLTDWKTSVYESNEGLISEDNLSLLQSGREQFTAFIRELLGDDRARRYKNPHFIVTTQHFNILHVDSTLTYGKGHDRDFVIGTGFLLDALKKCNRDLPTILLTHYSFDFLNQSERNYVETILADEGVQLWFAGHEHENLIRWQREKFLECQCGNLALQKGARSCFLTGELDLDTGDGAITVHAWYDGRNWAQYPFARFHSEDDSIYPFQVNISPEHQNNIDISRELARARESFSSLSAAGGFFSGVSLNPTILPDLEYSGKVYINGDANPYPMEQIMDRLWNDATAHPEISPNALILGDGGMGKSTMMYHVCQEMLRRKQLAVYVSLQARESAGESIIDHVLRCLYQTEDGRTKQSFERLTSSRHTHPDLILFIDGFNELTGSGARKYVSEVKALARCPGIQIIISSRLDFLRDYGLSHFGMIHVCDLREHQIEQLFHDRPEDWRNVLAQRNLLTLLRNPMMALLYVSTCPIVEKNLELDYLDWILPIRNASDLLHDYYMAQIAILINRDDIDGIQVFRSVAAIDYVLPAVAHRMEQRGNTFLEEAEFDTVLQTAVDEVNDTCFPKLPEKLQKIKRRFRIYPERLNIDEVYEQIVIEMVLLKAGAGYVAFGHQIFRDYLCAVYLHGCLMRNISVEELWHTEEIHKGVVLYLRNIGNEETWGENGTVSKMLLPYRGVEASDNDWFVRNVLNCWLSAGEGERDLSRLDLRKVSLSDHLKQRFLGTINIDGAWISKETLINDRCHDRIVGLCFSHDNRTMGAVSQNGIVSITNLLTQSQMIVGELHEIGSGTIGFDADDRLIVVTSHGAYCWPTISYDQIESGNAEDIVVLNNTSPDMQTRVNALKKRIQESDLDGIIQCLSENGRYFASGYESGFIQVWDVLTQECIASLSLSDSQIAAAAFSKDGTIAALGSGGKIVQIWDMERQKCSRILYFDHRVSKLRIPKGNNILECQFSDGTYWKVSIDSGEIEQAENPTRKQFISKSLLKQINRNEIADVKSTASGNAIIITKKGTAYTWDERRKKLSVCPKHMSAVTATAICASDDRFAASYSPEIYHADRNDGDRRRLLDGQRLVRTRIVSTGQCQLRIPTKGRSITKLKFFTSNRIILAGYATNGDVLLWELYNRIRYGREIGEWKTVEIIRNNEAEPLECAFPSKDEFISVYTDGTILIRPFSNSPNRTVVSTLPGIDAGVLKWNDLLCSDELKKMLNGYVQREDD